MGWTDGTSRQTLSHPEALARLAGGRIALLGESHDRADQHRWQTHVIAGLAALRPGIRVGFEMFPVQAQVALDAWTAGDLSEAAFCEQTNWKQVWGFDPELYMPLFRLCRDLRLPMHGLNVERPLVSEIGSDGWEALPAHYQDWLSPAVPATPRYREYLFAMTGGPRPGRKAQSPQDPAFDRFTRAQQVWDRSFACAIDRLLKTSPESLIVGVIGRGHLEYRHGTPAQLAGLGHTEVTVALPVDDARHPASVPDADGTTASELLYELAPLIDADQGRADS